MAEKTHVFNRAVAGSLTVGQHIRVFGVLNNKGNTIYYRQRKKGGGLWTGAKRIKKVGFNRSSANIVSYRQRKLNDLNLAYLKAIEEQEVKHEKEAEQRIEEHGRKKYIRVVAGRTYYGNKKSGHGMTFTQRDYAVMTVYAYIYIETDENNEDYKNDFSRTVMNHYIEEYINRMDARKVVHGESITEESEFMPSPNDDEMRWNGERTYDGYEMEEIDADEFFQANTGMETNAEEGKHNNVQLNLVFYDNSKSDGVLRIKAEYPAEVSPNGFFLNKKPEKNGFGMKKVGL